MTNSEIAESFAQIHEQEHENAALEKMQHEPEVGLEEDEKCIAGKLSILRKQLHDEAERAKNLMAILVVSRSKDKNSRSRSV